MAAQVEWVKWVPGTRFMVDGFAFSNPKCSDYFLTHCHSDHTVGLRRSFTGTIYCSEVSARLLAHEWGLHPPQVVTLHLGQPRNIAGVTVTALDANHCPGAIMLLFEVPEASGVGVTRILHTGDCRWQDELHAASCLAHKPVATLMLDTTYASHRHSFPSQQDAINMMVQAMQFELAEEPDCLFVVGSYHIGKERAYLGAAQAFGWKVYAPPAKRMVLQLVLPPEQLQLLTDDATATQLHVAPMASPDPVKLAAVYLDKEHEGKPWKRVIAFRPTGWSYNRSGKLRVWREERAAVYGIPYSEHSSWHDLRACVKTLRPKKIIPTVNVTSRATAAAIVERFVDLMDLSSNKGRIDRYLLRTPTDKPAASTAAVAAAAADGAGVLATAALSNVQPLQRESCSGVISSGCRAADHRTLDGTCVVSCSHDNAGITGDPAGLPECRWTQSSWLEIDAAETAVAAHHTSTPGIRSHQGLLLQGGTTKLAAVAFDGSPGSAAAGANTSSLAVAGLLQFQGDSRPVLMAHDEPLLDLSSVDIAQQQRLLEEVQRRMKLKRSLSLVAAKGSTKTSSCQQARACMRKKEKQDDAKK